MDSRTQICSGLCSQAMWVAAMLCASQSIVAAVDIPWVVDLPSAIEEALRSSKLIMVVDLPTYSTAGDIIAEANEAFLIGSVGSQRLDRIFRYECLPVQRSVGVPRFAIQVANCKAVGAGSYGLQRPVTYFCAPMNEDREQDSLVEIDVNTPASKLKVIHFCVGYVGPDQLATAARWAIDNYKQAKSESVAYASGADATISNASESIAEYLEVAHADSCPAYYVSQVESSASLLRNANDELDETSASDVRCVLQATLTFCETRRTNELLVDRKTPIDETAVRSLTLSANTNPGHLALALLSGIRLAQLEQHSFEIVAHGGCYSTDTERLDNLDDFFQDAQSAGQGVLCCIRSSVAVAGNDARTNEILSLPIIERRLHVVERVPMLEAELSAIQHRRRRRPIELPTDGEVVFALFDANGELAATICDTEPMARVLARRLDTIGRDAKRKRNLKAKQKPRSWK